MKRPLLTCGLVAVMSVCICCDPMRNGGGRAAPAQDKEAKKGEQLDTLLKNVTSKNENVRLDAITKLQDFGAKAAAAAPDLARALADKNEDIRLGAALALGKIGKAAVPDLMAPLTSTDEDVRY